MPEAIDVKMGRLEHKDQVADRRVVIRFRLDEMPQHARGVSPVPVAERIRNPIDIGPDPAECFPSHRFDGMRRSVRTER